MGSLLVEYFKYIKDFKLIQYKIKSIIEKILITLACSSLNIAYESLS